MEEAEFKSIDHVDLLFPQYQATSVLSSVKWDESCSRFLRSSLVCHSSLPPSQLLPLFQEWGPGLGEGWDETAVVMGTICRVELHIFVGWGQLLKIRPHVFVHV